MHLQLNVILGEFRERNLRRETIQLTGSRDYNDIVLVNEPLLWIFLFPGIVTVHDESISRVFRQGCIQPSLVQVEIVAIKVLQFFGPITTDE